MPVDPTGVCSAPPMRADDLTPVRGGADALGAEKGAEAELLAHDEAEATHLDAHAGKEGPSTSSSEAPAESDVQQQTVRMTEALVIRFKLGDLIERRQFSEGRRITIQEIAEATGVNRMTLSKILNHRGYSTGTDILDRLCAYFGCSLAELAEHVPD